MKKLDGLQIMFLMRIYAIKGSLIRTWRSIERLLRFVALYIRIGRQGFAINSLTLLSIPVFMVLILALIFLTEAFGQSLTTNVCESGQEQCVEKHQIGDTVTLTAEPDEGWYFSGWLSPEAGCVGTGDCTIKITQNKNYEAHAVFSELPTETLTVYVFGMAGKVTSDPKGIECSNGNTCAAKFPRGAKVILTATGNPFTWRGLSCSGSGTCTTTMTKSKTLNVRFR